MTNLPSGLRARHVSKTFAGRTVLRDVDIAVEAGEVRALVGHNGSGKSTLVKILAGVHAPDPGAELSLFGRAIAFPFAGARSPGELRFVHQDLGLVLNMTVTENFALGRGFATRRGGAIHWNREREFAREHIRAFDATIDPDAMVAALSPAQRAVVAIARAVQGVSGDHRVVVLDEPTAALPREESTRLYGVIDALRQQGAAVLLISHSIDEVLTLCDTVTVLRDGEVVADTRTADLSKRSLIELIVGGPTGEVFARASQQAGEVVLEARGIVGTSLESLNLTVRAGEVVGIAGITGSGREEAIPLLSGDVAPRAGSLAARATQLAGKGVHNAIRAGVGSIPADRLGKAAIGGFRVRENISLPRLDDLLRPWWGASTIDPREDRRQAQHWIDVTDVRPGDPDAQFGSLSGGNQQKAVIARWLRMRPDVLLIDEPTQGVDVGAKHTIYTLLAQAAQDGMALVIASSDTDELSQIAQRVVVLVDGVAQEELSGESLTPQTLARACLGDRQLPKDEDVAA